MIDVRLFPVPDRAGECGLPLFPWPTQKKALTLPLLPSNADPESDHSLYCQAVIEIIPAVRQPRDDWPCCACSGTDFIPRFGLPETSFTIECCERCGCGRLHPAPTISQIASFYAADYYGTSGSKFGAWTEWLVRLVARRQTRFIARHVPQDGSVLDVGCGRGVVSSPLARAGFAVTGQEISTAAVAGIDEGVRVVISDSLNKAAFDADAFDLVIIWHVLEHLPEPEATLREIHRVLRPGGRLVVAVPNFASWQAKWAGSAWFHLDPPRHLFHFPAEALRNLLERTGYSVESDHHFSLRQNPFGWLQSAINRLLPRFRNRLYDCLLNGPAARGMSGAERIAWFLVYWAGMPLALLPAIVAAACKSGGTIHFVAKTQKPNNDITN